MARPLRIAYEGAVYHVTARGNERKKIFFTKRDCQKFKEFLAAGESKYRFLLHAYVLIQRSPKSFYFQGLTPLSSCHQNLSTFKG
jgi:hypothetical protein